MRRVRLLFNLTLFIVPPVVVAGGATVLVRRLWTYLNGDARLAGLISVEASRALGREVRVGDIKFRTGAWSLLPNRVELDDIRIAQYPTLNSALFAHADKVIVWYDLNQVLFAKDPKTPLVKEVQVVGPQVALSRDAQGHWNFEQIFKPTGQSGRPFTDKLSFSNASLAYSDLRFPHPVGVTPRPFITRLSGVSGVVLARPDKSVAFDVAGRPDAALLRDFHATGIAGLNPTRVDVRLIANRVSLPAFAERFVPPAQARLQSGVADIDVSAVYAPPADTPLAAVDLNAIDAHGTVQADNLNLTAPRLAEPLRNARARGTFTTDSFAGSLRGQYGGVTINLSGQAIGLLRREPGADGKLHTAFAMPTVSLQGDADRADVARLVRVLGLDQRLAQFPTIKPAVRARIVATTGQIRDVRFQVAGLLNNPTVATSLHVDAASSFGFGAQNVEARALLDNRVVTADARGQAEGGEVALRTRVLTQEPGTFDVEAHARRVPLTALRSLVSRDIGGTANVDLALRGRRRQTPFISAQAEAQNVRLNGQSLQSLYARAATVGGKLIVRQARLDDAKGFALVTGSIDLRSQALNLNVAADNIDVHALLAALRPAKTQTTGAAGQGTGVVSSADKDNSAPARAANTLAADSVAASGLAVNSIASGGLAPGSIAANTAAANTSADNNRAAANNSASNNAAANTLAAIVDTVDTSDSKAAQIIPTAGSVARSRADARLSRRSAGRAGSAATMAVVSQTPPPLFDLNAAQGQGFLRGRIEGTLRDPEVSGRVSAFGLQAGQASLDRVITDFSLSRRALVIAKGTAERYPGVATFSGQATDLTSGNPLLQVQASAANLDIADALRLAGLQGRILPGSQATPGTIYALDRYVILGSLSSGPVALEGRLKSLRLAQPVTLRGEGVNINGLPITNVSATANLQAGTLRLLDAHADAAGGTISATGTLTDITDKAKARLTADIRAQGLNATRLSHALPPDVLPYNVEGTLNLTAHAQGALAALDATVGLDARSVLLTDEQGGTIDVGDVQARAALDGYKETAPKSGRFAGGVYRLESAVVSQAGSAPGTAGRVTLGNIAYDPKSHVLSGMARWNELRFERLRELFNKSPFALRGPGLRVADALKKLTGPVLGSITGQASLSGTLEAPTADVSWNTSGLQIEDHRITTFGGSALAGKTGVQTPSPTTPAQMIRLQSDDIDIDVLNLNAVFGGGKLSADIRANKLNLEFAHHFLPAPSAPSSDPNAPAPTTQEKALASLQNLTGSGEAEIVASGTTASPVLEASINLRNVGLHDPLSNTDQVISRIDVSHLTIQEGKIDTDIIEVSKVGGAVASNTVAVIASAADAGKSGANTAKAVKPPRTPKGASIANAANASGAAGQANGAIAAAANAQPEKFEASARGSIDFSWKPLFDSQPPYIAKNAGFDVTATVPEQNLSVLSLFGRNLNITSDGKFSLRAHIFNTLEEPRVFGALTLNADRLQLGTAATSLYHTGLRDVRGQIDFRNDSIAIHDGFTARTQVFTVSGRDEVKADAKQEGTPIQLTGSLPFKGNAAEGIRLRSDRVVFNETPLPGSHTGGIRGQADVNLNLSGSLQTPTLGGIVTVTDTTVSPPRDFGGTGGSSVPFPLNPSFDLLVRLGKNVRAQNTALNALVAGNISIKGPLYADAGNAAPPTQSDPLATLNNANGSGAALSPPRRLGLNVVGRLTIPDGRLILPTARFTILPPGQITVAYPSPDASAGGLPTLGVDVDLKARTYLTATSLSGTRKRYTVTVAARGPISGATLDPQTGDMRLALNFTTDPNDLATSQNGLQQRLAGVLGADALGQFGRNPGQVLAQQLTNVATSAVIPGVFDNLARATGFEDLSVGYDPVQRLNLLISRQIVGPLYITYNRSLGSTVETYDLKLSLRLKDRYQLSYEQNETNEQRTLLEGVWRY